MSSSSYSGSNSGSISKSINLSRASAPAFFSTTLIKFAVRSSCSCLPSLLILRPSTISASLACSRYHHHYSLLLRLLLLLLLLLVDTETFDDIGEPCLQQISSSSLLRLLLLLLLLLVDTETFDDISEPCLQHATISKGWENPCTPETLNPKP